MCFAAAALHVRACVILQPALHCCCARTCWQSKCCLKLPEYFCQQLFRNAMATDCNNSHIQ